MTARLRRHAQDARLALGIVAGWVALVLLGADTWNRWRR